MDDKHTIEDTLLHPGIDERETNETLGKKIMDALGREIKCLGSEEYVPSEHPEKYTCKHMAFLLDSKGNLVDYWEED